MAWGNTQRKTINKPLLLLLINDYVGKSSVALPNSIARKFHNNKEKNKKKGVGALSIYLGSVLLHAAMINSSSFFLIFFNNSSLLCQC
jgi:hypothetical protein